MCSNQHTDVLRFLFTEDSMKIRKDMKANFQATIFIELFHKKFWFVILHQLATFHYQTVFTSQVIQ